MSFKRSIREFPTPEPTPNIAIEFSPHKEAYTYNVGEESYAPANTWYGPVGELITFTATVKVSGSGQSVTGYEWRFGDGTIGSGNPVTHTYTFPNEIIVTLVVTDNRGKKWLGYKSMYLKH